MSDKMQIQQPENKQNEQKDAKKKEQELSEEDKKLKEDIQLMVERLKDKSEEIAFKSLDMLKQLVRSSTTSMTSVPKPFKFLKVHFQGLVDYYNSSPESDIKSSLADFLSVLSMTMAEPNTKASLNFLLAGTKRDFMNWGHAYLSNLASDITQEFETREDQNNETSDLIDLVTQIVPYFFSHNSEHDAIDLLMEVDKLELLQKLECVNAQNFDRVIQYLTATSPFTADTKEFRTTLEIAYRIAMRYEFYTYAIRIAMKLDDKSLIEEIFKVCKNPLLRKQLAFLIARQRIVIDGLQDDVSAIASNTLLSEYYIQFAKELDLLEPKTPAMVYKTHLEDRSSKILKMDSALQNLADTYTNAFVNCAFKSDTLMIKQEEKDAWVWKLKDEGMIAASASIGLIDMWDMDEGSGHISSYLDTQGYVKCGASIAIGLFNSGIISEADPAKGMLVDALEAKDPIQKVGAIIGLGLAYAGSARQDLKDILLDFISDTGIDQNISAFAALSLGLIFVGKCDSDIGSLIVTTLMDRPKEQLMEPNLRYFSIGLGLLFLAQQQNCETLLETINIIQNEEVQKYCKYTLIGCAYVGSGNILQVQELLNVCTEKLEGECYYAQAAVIGIALIASSEDVGNEMAMRLMNTIMQYSNKSVKRALPMALALLNVSNPKVNVTAILIKLAYEDDLELAMRATLCLGIVGAGTNSSKLAEQLRTIAANSTDGKFLYITRIAQGLLHMGKGTLTLHPYYSDRFLLSKTGMSGLIIFMHSCIDIEQILLGKLHYTLFYLGLSITPRFCFTLNEQLENMTVNLRVGNAVDAIGTSGQGKKITAFQTQTSPVLISHGQRAELGTQEYIPVQDTVFEDFVIIIKNPDYVPEEDKPKRKTSANN